MIGITVKLVGFEQLPAILTTPQPVPIPLHSHPCSSWSSSASGTAIRSRSANVSKPRGRMLPEGVTYQASWMEPTGGRCFQIMEAPSLDALNVWVERWDDLAAFEIIPVVTSAEFWANLPNE
jgi:hypothetical protein